MELKLEKKDLFDGSLIILFSLGLLQDFISFKTVVGVYINTMNTTMLSKFF